MRILAVSDEVIGALYSPDVRKRLGPIDLLLSCGDLPYSYLEYLVTILKAPHAFFVHGNHDTEEIQHCGRTLRDPGGWVNADRRVLDADGVLVAGLEGSIRYRPGGAYQYTELETFARALRLLPAFLLNHSRYGRYVDIFIAHSPPAGIHDGPDGPHKGFRTLCLIMRWFRPRLLLHGHKHHYGPEPWHSRYLETDIVNVHPFRALELEGDKVTYGRIYRR
ncbi:MAG TPA: metallophosphoesterase [Chloroflexi bacterium]|nr:metallophosphoesterase [Chloroflexota bacterium]